MAGENGLEAAAAALMGEDIDLGAVDDAPTPDELGGYDRDARLSRQEELSLEDEGQVQAEEKEDEEVDESAESAPDAEDEPRTDGDDFEEPEYAETITEIAESMEITPDELLGRLKHKVGDDEVTLADVFSQYNAERDVTAEKKVWEDARAEHEAHRKQGEELFQTSLNVHLGQLEALNKYFEDQKNSPAMNELRASDPAEWGAQNQEIDSFLKILGAEKEKAINNFHEYKTQSQQQFLQEQGQILKRDVPEWGEAKMNEAVEALKGFGFADEEIPALADARAIKAVLELNSLRARVKELEGADAARKAAIKKVGRKVNPVLKANNKNRSEQKKVEKARDELTGRFVKSNSLQDAAALVDNMMGDTFE